MKQNISIFSILLLLLLVIVNKVTAQSFSRENTITKVFPVIDDTEIEINNKYGNISIETWEIDSVKFVINYKVTSNKESKLTRGYEAIDFEFIANEYYIVANTTFKGNSSFWSDVSDIASNLFASGTNTSIDYTVYIPGNTELGLTLKYGNIFLADYFGSLNIQLSNGNLKAHNIIGNTKFDIAFSDITVNYLENCDIKAGYSTLSIETGNNINIASNSSEIEITTIENLIVDSNHDKIWIDNAKSITGETTFTKSIYESIIKQINLTTKYGSLKLKNIEPNADGIDLQSSNTSVNININADDSYNINIMSGEKAEVTVSTNIGDFITSKTEDDTYINNAFCKYGTSENPVFLNFKIKSGLLSIKLK